MRPSVSHRLGLLLLLLGPFALAVAGCNALPVGSVDAVRASSASARGGQAYLLRGWRGLWSEGMDTLAAELTAAGVEARVYRDDQAGPLGDALVEKNRGAKDADPLVLIGFSFGADEALRVAGRVGRDGIPVPLLVTLDPVTPPPVPANVGRCVNFYQSNGAWDALPWLRGVPVRAAGTGGELTNTNLRDRPDLLEPDTGHHTIAGNVKVHRAILAEVLRVCPPRHPSPPPSPPPLPPPPLLPPPAIRP